MASVQQNVPVHHVHPAMLRLAQMPLQQQQQCLQRYQLQLQLLLLLAGSYLPRMS
jgi:hypothetical protein